MKRLKIPSTLAFLLSTVAFANYVSASELSFRISNDTVGGGLEGNVGESDMFAGFEHMYKDKDDAINISNLNFHTRGQTVVGNMPTTVMIGLEATHMKEGAFKGVSHCIWWKHTDEPTICTWTLTRNSPPLRSRHCFIR